MLEKTARNTLDSRKSNQSILREINPEYSLEGLMKLELQYFGHLMWTADSLEKSLMLGKIKGRRRRGVKEGSEDEMAGWHHKCYGQELGQTLEDGEGQRGLVCHSPRGCKESDSTGWLNNNNVTLITLGFRPGKHTHYKCCMDKWLAIYALQRMTHLPFPLNTHSLSVMLLIHYCSLKYSFGAPVAPESCFLPIFSPSLLWSQVIE